MAFSLNPRMLLSSSTFVSIVLDTSQLSWPGSALTAVVGLCDIAIAGALTAVPAVGSTGEVDDATIDRCMGESREQSMQSLDYNSLNMDGATRVRSMFMAKERVIPRHDAHPGPGVEGEEGIVRRRETHTRAETPMQQERGERPKTDTHAFDIKEHTNIFLDITPHHRAHPHTGQIARDSHRRLVA